MATRTVEDLVVGAADTISVRIPLQHSAIALEGIEASGSPRCELEADTGEQTQRVWEAARKTLAATRFTESAGTYRYDLERYSRVLAPQSLKIRHETRTSRQTSSRRPIESLPVEFLLDKGWVASEPVGNHYFAPDAHVLLSDEFLANHCLRLRAPDESQPDLLGLEFRPIRTRVGRTDIQGVLWLSRETGAVQWLDFSYRNLPGVADQHGSDQIGGRVEFHGLPDGSWIVSKWYIRMPLMTEERDRVFGRRRAWLNGIAEDGGGVVSAVRAATGHTAYAEASGAIMGEVWDPVRGAPVAPGRVALIGVGAEAELDARGRFEIRELPPGAYRLALLQPSLRGLDGNYELADAYILPGDAAQVRLDAPHPNVVMATVCGMDPPVWIPDTGVLLGDVVEVDSRVAVAGTTVVAEWVSVNRLRTRLQAEARTIETATNALGAFRICGVPTDGRTITVTVNLDGQRSSSQVSLSATEPVATVSLRVGR